MKFSAIGFALLTTVSLLASSGYAQDADYNQNLKSELKKEDAMTVSQKKAKKPLTKAEKAQAKKVASAKAKAKLAAKKKLQAKHRALPKKTVQTNVAQSEDVKNPKVLAAGMTNTEPAQAIPSQGPVVLNTQTLPAVVATPAPAPSAAPVTTSVVPAAPIAAATPAASPAVAAVEAPVVPAQPQIQPATNVEASGVTAPKTDELHKEREDLEHQTENTMMEKLENDRLQAERERAQRLVLTPVPTPTPAPSATPAPVVAPLVAPSATPAPSASPVASPSAAPVAAVVTPAVSPVAETPTSAIAAEGAEVYGPAPAPVAVEAGPSPVAVTPTEPVADQTQADATVATKATDKATDEEEFRHFSLGGLAGVGSYPSVGNITGAFAVGALAQYKLDPHLAIQSTFNYSSYNIQNASYCYYCGGSTLIENLDQYNVTGGVNYSFLTGRVTPVVGALVSYTRRQYSNDVGYGYTGNSNTGSNAFDGGLMAGLDFRLSKFVVLGAQFQYFWNITYKTDDPLAYGGIYGSTYGSPIEGLSYYFATLNLRFEL